MPDPAIDPLFVSLVRAGLDHLPVSVRARTQSGA